jgi:hypothetical protein
MAGNLFPSSISRKAPPPVQMYPIRSARGDRTTLAVPVRNDPVGDTCVARSLDVDGRIPDEQRAFERGGARAGRPAAAA